MLEYAVEPRYQVRPQDTLTDDIFDRATRKPDHVALRRKTGGQWWPVTSAHFADEVRRLAAGLIAAGIAPGDRVGLMSRTRYEWTLCDYAIWTVGAVTVPIYETSSADQVAWILADSGAVATFVETEQHAATVAGVRDRLPLLRHVWELDADVIDELSRDGTTVTAEQVEQRRRGVRADDLATIVYTSGTTGRPKGCALTHRNLVAEVYNVLLGDGVTERLFNEEKSTLLFLPLAHSFARLIEIGALRSGTCLGHADMKQVVPGLQEFRPTCVLSVPRVFEKVYNSAKHKAAAEGHAKIFDAAEQVAIAYSQAIDMGGPGLGLRARHLLYDRLVYRKLRAVMGGNVEYSVSGGAPLGARLGHFFRGVGITVLEGYGLTETSPATNSNLPGAQKIGTVGRPIPGVTVRIAHDGEVLIKSEIVFGGYWHNETATKEVIDPDGWFHTGDIGQLDDEGYLEITGRKKDLIVTSTGKNVAPAVLEDRLRSHWLVSQCMVVGDRRPYVAALVTLDAEAFTEWKADRGKPADAAAADLRDDPALLAEIQSAVDDANLAVSRAESIRRFHVLEDDFTETGGQLTPTLKVRRNVVLEQYAAEVERLYGWG